MYILRKQHGIAHDRGQFIRPMRRVSRGDEVIELHRHKRNAIQVPPENSGVPYRSNSGLEFEVLSEKSMWVGGAIASIGNLRCGPTSRVQRC
jgi:hypothetical protein